MLEGTEWGSCLMSECSSKALELYRRPT